VKLRVSMKDRGRGRKEGEGIFTWRWPLGVLLETLALLILCVVLSQFTVDPVTW
jgi:hypothetical protein